MRNIIIILLISISISTPELSSQGTAGEKALYESRRIVDMPNAGILEKGAFAIHAIAYQQGGIMLQLDAAPFTDFNMGLSFSGTNIIGFGDVNWQSIPGIQLRYRILNETITIPAFLIGVNTQGRGDYNRNDNRFITPSPGIFLAASKNYQWLLGTVAFHAGINYSFESKSDDRIPNVYVGFEHSIGKAVSLNFEYNSTLNDGNKNYMKNKGLLNIALRWSLAKGITLELQTRDILKNIEVNKSFTRAICLEYINMF